LSVCDIKKLIQFIENRQKAQCGVLGDVLIHGS